MTKKRCRSGSYQEYLLKTLRDPQVAAEYINTALEEVGDPEALLMALRNVAMAHGMKTVSKHAKLNRESFYRMLSKNGNPNVHSLHALLSAMGLTLRVEMKAA